MIKEVLFVAALAGVSAVSVASGVFWKNPGYVYKGGRKTVGWQMMEDYVKEYGYWDVPSIEVVAIETEVLSSRRPELNHREAKYLGRKIHRHLNVYWPDARYNQWYRVMKAQRLGLLDEKFQPVPGSRKINDAAFQRAEAYKISPEAGKGWDLAGKIYD